MLVGVPKEIKDNEYRVGMAPESVREIVAHGHNVIVETNAGGGIGATDEDYQRAGADIVGTAAEVFAKAEMVVKVKEPQAGERAMLREGQILYTYLHLAPDPEQTKDLVNSGAICIAYENRYFALRRVALVAPHVRSRRSYVDSSGSPQPGKNPRRHWHVDGRSARC